MRILQLVDWMTAVNLRVSHFDVTFEELENEDSIFSSEKVLATSESLFVQLKTFDGNAPWIIALDLYTAKVVVLPWWYFREAEL